MADAELVAGDAVQVGAVGGAVVGHDPLDGDVVAGVEGDGSFEELDGGGGFLVAVDFDVGQAGGVVDADVDELPAGVADAPAVGGVGRAALVLA